MAKAPPPRTPPAERYRAYGLKVLKEAQARQRERSGQKHVAETPKASKKRRKGKEEAPAD